MDASPLEGVALRWAALRSDRVGALVLLVGCVVLAAAAPSRTTAQQIAEPVLEGRVEKAGSAVPTATVVLHRVTAALAGEIDSVQVDTDGRFRLPLPSVPDPGGTGEVYFASVRHAGVVYFGPPVLQAVQLDSVYTIEVYDTVSVSEGAPEVSVSVRYVVIQPAEEAWEITDLLQISNEGLQTLVPPSADGPVWSYPLPLGIREAIVGEGAIAPEGVTISDGTVRVTAPLPPGTRQVVVRYLVDELDFTLPAPGTTAHMELLVREPAPLLEVGGLVAVESVPMEQGVTYRRYAALDLSDTSVTVARGTPPTELPVKGIAVSLTLLLTLAGLWTYLRSNQGSTPVAVSATGGSPQAGAGFAGAPARSALLLDVALVDEALARPDIGESEADDLRRRRGDLIRRLEELR